MQPLDYILIALATFYLAYSFTLLEGPFKVFTHLRFWLPLGGLTACIYCMALWVGLVCFVLYQTALQPIVAVCAIAGLGMAIFRITGAQHV